MDPKQTAKNYNQIASHWAGNAFNRKNGINQHKRALRFANIGGRAIDVGCGSSGRFIALLINEGFETEGLDLSEEMLVLARTKHPKTQFHHADICQWEFPRKYDFISAWDSVWHVPLQQQAAVLEKLCQALSPGGVLIFTTGAVDTPGEVTNPFLGQDLYTAVLGIPKTLEILEQNSCICRHLEYDEPDPGLHLYIIAQKSR